MKADTVSAAALGTGAQAVTAAEAANDVEVLIVSVPIIRNTDIADHVRSAPESAAVIDTSNYYPMRDRVIQDFVGCRPQSE